MINKQIAVVSHRKTHHCGLIKRPLVPRKRLRAVLSSCAFSALIAAKAISPGPVDINAADAKTLAENLNGVGLRKAEAIVAYRNNYGNFTSLEEIAAVKGISIAILEKNRDLIQLKK